MRILQLAVAFVDALIVAKMSLSQIAYCYLAQLILALLKKEVQPYRFFSDDLVLYSPTSQDNWMKYSLHQIHENKEIKAIVLKILDELGTGIKDICVDIKKESLDAENLPPFLSEEFKKNLLSKK